MMSGMWQAWHFCVIVLLTENVPTGIEILMSAGFSVCILVVEKHDA